MILAMLRGLGRWLLVGSALSGCAHSKSDTADQLRRTADQFHKLVRWNDLRGASELLTADRREAFLDEVSKYRDERDLKVTDYELEDLKLNADGKSGTVVAKMSWYRLPSVTQEEEKVVSHFVERNGAWFIDRQERGPFSRVLSNGEEGTEAEPKARQVP